MPINLFIVTSQPEAAVIALNEIQKINPTARMRKRLSPEAQLVSLTDWETESAMPGYFAATPDGTRRGFIFVRHLFPVHITTGLNEPDIMPRLASLATSFDKSKCFSVQMRASDKNPAYAEAVTLIHDIEQHFTGLGFTLRDKSPDWVVSLYLHEATLYMGVSSCAGNLSGWNGGMHQFKKDTEFISRAGFKLLEAAETFNIPALKPDMPSSRALRALDLGAAPGGWTKILLDAGLHVTAVDPAALSESLTGHPNLIHFRDVAQRFQAEPAHFDIIVNDMRVDITESCKIMLDMAGFLSAGGAALMTLKLPREHWYKKVTRAIALLEKKYAILGARQLFHNRSEATVYMKRVLTPE